MCETITKTRKLPSFLQNLQTYCHFQLDLQNGDQHTGGKWLINTARTISCNAWSSSVRNVTMT